MIRKASAIAFFLIAAAITLLGNAMADDVSLHGFLEGNYSTDAATKNPDGGGFKLAEERLQLKLDATKDPFHVFIRADTFYDHVDGRWNSELREGYLDVTSSKWDARLGRQVITWGLGDMVFINDVFPKDYTAFFSGRPLEYMKKGVDGVKFGIYPGFASFELVAVPFFTHDTYPSADRFSMFNPMQDITDTDKSKTPVTLGNTEFAARAYRDIAGFDTSVYFYKGFFRQPSMMPDNPVNPTKLTLFYPKLSVYGTSTQGRALDGILSLEAGYYDSTDDRAGTNPIIPNSQTRYLIGYQRQMWEDFTMGIQYYCEYMSDYSKYVQSLPSGFPQGRKLHELTTVRLTQLLVNQTLKLSFFAFYSPSDGDYMLNPEIKYNFNDHIWSALGANIFFGGNRSCQFGQFAKDDNVYVQVRYDF